MLDLPASGSSDLKLQNNGLESGCGSPEANLLVDNEESMGRDLDLVEENLTSVSGELSAEQFSHVVAVDEKLCTQKETLLIRSATLDVSCILLLLFYAALNLFLSLFASQETMLSSSVLP